MKASWSWKSVYFMYTVSSFHKQLKLMLYLRGRLAFPLTQPCDHTVSSYCHKQVWPWGGFDPFWVKVKPGGWQKAYFRLGTVFGCFAGWALCSEQERGSLSHHQHASTVQGKSKHSGCRASAYPPNPAGSKLPPMTVGMALLPLAQGRSSSARVIFSPVPLEGSKASRGMSRKQQGYCTKHLADIPDEQKMWPAPPLVCCTLVHSWNVLWSSGKKEYEGWGGLSSLPTVRKAGAKKDYLWHMFFVTASERS